jgi:hypothetical protein
MSFASCAKGMAQIWNLTIVKMFNEDIARMVTSVWIDVAWVKISSSFAIPSYEI